MAERVLTELLETEVNVEVGRFRGTWLTNFGVDELRISLEESPLHSVELPALRVSYDLPGLFGSAPLEAVEKLRLSGSVVTLQEEAHDSASSEEEDSEVAEGRRADDAPLSPGELLAELLRRAPRRLRLELSGELRLRSEAGSSATLGEWEAEGTLAQEDDSTRGIAVSVKLRESELLPLPGGLSSSFYLATTRDALIVTAPKRVDRRSEEGEMLALTGELALEQGSERLRLLRLEGRYGPLTAGFSADPSRAAGSLELDPSASEAGTLPLPRSLLRDLLPASDSLGIADPAAFGPTAVHASLERDRRESASIVETLLSDSSAARRLGVISVRADTADSRLGPLRQVAANAKASVDGESVTLERLELDIPGAASLEADGRLNMETGELSRGNLRAELPSLATLREAFLPKAAWARQLSGSFAVSARLRGGLYDSETTELLRGLSGEFALEGEQLSVAGLELDRFATDGRFEEDELQVDPLRARVDEFALRTRTTLRLHPEEQRLEVQEAEITVPSEPPERFTLTEATAVTFSPTALSVEETMLESRLGSIRLAGRLDEEGAHAELTGEGLTVAPLGPLLGLQEDPEGRLTVRAEVHGELTEPRVYLSLKGEELSYRGEPASVSLDLRQEDDELRLSELELEVGSQLSLAGSGTVPFYLTGNGVIFRDLKSASLTLSAKHEKPGTLLPESVAAYLPTEEATLEAELLERSGDLRVELSSILREEASSDGREAPFNGSTMRIFLRLTEESDDRLNVSGRGVLQERQLLQWDGQLQVPGLSRGEPDLSPETLSTEGHAEFDIPLELLPDRLPSLVFAEGRLRGELSLSGTAEDPEIGGTASTRRSAVRMAGPLPRITTLSAALRLEEGELRLSELSGELGRAPFSGSGRLELPGDEDAGSLDLSFSGDRLLLYSDPTLRLRSDVKIRVNGTTREPRIGGALRIREGEYEQHVPLLGLDTPPTIEEEALELFSFPGEWAAATDLDVEVEGDRSFEIRNNLLETDLSLDLHIGGTMQVPVMTGRIFTQEALLRLPLTTLEIRQLAITFPSANPFQPNLEARGRSRMRGYELVVRASGELPAVEIEVSSTPPLPRDEALLLLTTGYADVGERETEEQAVRAVGEFLGRQLIEVLLAEDVVDEDIAARVEVAVGRRMSDSGEEVIEVEYRLSEEERWFLSFERDRFDEYNLGVSWRLWFD
ncbi:MAG: translocation/assembly module TamB domain-containing protein [Spirochaetaceae bacterium]